MPRIERKTAWAGNMRHMATIQRKNVAVSGGIATTTWENYVGPVRAARNITTTQELFRDEIVKDRNRVEIRIWRTGPGTEILSNMRVVFTDAESGNVHYYLIVSAQLPNSPRYPIVLVCEEDMKPTCN